MRTLTTLALLVAAAPATAHARPAPPAEPAQQLAIDVTVLAGRGYRLRGMEVTEQGDRIDLALVMAGRDDARRLDLAFADGGRRPLLYRNAPASPPTDARVYAAEAWLVPMLAAGPPEGLREECGLWYLDGVGDDGGPIDPDRYYTVERTVTGEAAGRELAAELVSALEGGAELTWAGSAADEEWAIDFELDAAQRRVLRAHVDGRFRVLDLEVRVSPPSPGWQHYARPAALAAAVRAGGAIHALVVDPDAGERGRLVVRMNRGRKFAIALHEFVAVEGDCPC